MESTEVLNALKDIRGALSGNLRDHETLEKMGRPLATIFANNPGVPSLNLSSEIRMAFQAQQFIDSWQWFGNQEMDFADWVDIAEKGLLLLKTFLDSDVEDITLFPGHREFMEQASARFGELFHSEKYRHKMKVDFP